MDLREANSDDLTNYHCENGQDSVDTLDHDFALSVVRVTTGAALRALDEP